MSAKKVIKTVLQIILFACIGGAILYYVFQTQQENYFAECANKGIAKSDCSLLDKVIADFKSANYWWIAASVLAFMLSNMSRAIRWCQAIRPLGYKTKFSNSFLSIMAGYGANLFFPRIGEVARCGVMSRYEKVPADALMGTVVAERIIDVICLALVIGLAMLLEADMIIAAINDLRNNSTSTQEASSGTPWILYFGIAAAIGLMLLVIFRKKLASLGIVDKLKGVVKRFVDGILSIRHLENPWLYIAHTIFIWVMYFMMTFLCFKAFEPTASLGPVAALTTFVFGSLGIVIPSPGGMGTYHFLTTEALQLYGLSGDDGFSFSNLMFFSVNVFGNIFFALLAVILLPLINRGYVPAMKLGEAILPNEENKK